MRVGNDKNRVLENVRGDATQCSRHLKVDNSSAIMRETTPHDEWIWGGEDKSLITFIFSMKYG